VSEQNSPIPSPKNGDGKRCPTHGCWCIIKSVGEDVWDPDWFCVKCTPEYVIPIVPSCINCIRFKENIEECQLVREQGLTVCKFWPDNNLPEKVRD
jgi:hypothetical protein